MSPERLIGTQLFCEWNRRLPFFSSFNKTEWQILRIVRFNSEKKMYGKKSSLYQPVMHSISVNSSMQCYYVFRSTEEKCVRRMWRCRINSTVTQSKQINCECKLPGRRWFGWCGRWIFAVRLSHAKIVVGHCLRLHCSWQLMVFLLFVLTVTYRTALHFIA